MQKQKKSERPRIVSWELKKADWKRIFAIEWRNFRHWQLMCELREAPDGSMPESGFEGEVEKLNYKLARGGLPFSLRPEWAYPRRRWHDQETRIRICRVNRPARL